MRQDLVAALQLDEHAVDAALVLNVEVRVQDVARRRLEADDVPDADVLLERDAEVLDFALALGHRVLTLGGDGVGQVLDQGHEVR